MALNKAQTSLGVKVVLVVLIITFVASFIPIVGNIFGGGGTQTNTGAGSQNAIDSQFQPTVAALTQVLQSEPESYTVLVNLGNTYFDWAAQTQQAAQTDTTTVGADQPLWVAAKDAYRRAVAVKDDEPAVVVDYAITAFYTGETNIAIEQAERIAKANPQFAMAHFNLGIFYGSLGQNAKAIAAFETYMKVDPEGKTGDLQYAKDQIAALKGSAGATTAP